MLCNVIADLAMKLHGDQSHCSRKGNQTLNQGRGGRWTEEKRRIWARILYVKRTVGGAGSRVRGHFLQLCVRACLMQNGHCRERG